MNTYEIYPIVLLAAPVLLLAVTIWIVARKQDGKLIASEARNRELREQLELVCQSIGGLTAGAVGVDRRVHRLERLEKHLAERQENFENQQSDEQPYGQAIRLVQQGAGVNRLVSELEISPSEAELIVRLHGHRETA